MPGLHDSNGEDEETEDEPDHKTESDNQILQVYRLGGLRFPRKNQKFAQREEIEIT